MRTVVLLPVYLCLLLVGALAHAQIKDTTLGFGSPLGIPIYLSGTFGEPRGNHFHAGMDIRTESREGLPIYSVHDGFISRIKISGRGYGKAIYVQHHNGYTSVYGHLSGFPPKLDSLIKAYHYQRENFEIDEVLLPNVYPVKKGELIAFSGNTGGSAGPHLHFELRNTSTEYAYNPQLYGFPVQDNVPPNIHSLSVYARDLNLVSPQTYPVKKVGNTHKLTKDTLYFNTDTIAFGLHTTDKMQNSNNTNGIYSLQICLDDSVCYRFRMDSISFAETRYVQCHVDHCEKIESGSSVYRIHRLPGNDFTFLYDVQQNDGYVVLRDSVFTKIELSSTDFQGNTSTLVFYVSRGKKEVFKMQPMNFDTIFYHDRPNTFHGAGMRAHFPAGTFYNKVLFYYKVDSIQLSSLRSFGPLHRLHKDVEPVHNNFGLSLFVNEVPRHLWDKSVVVRIDRKGRIKAYDTTHDGQAWFTANPREFGNFTLAIDTVKPSIRPQNFTNGSVMTGKKELRIIATDNLSGIASYKATIDGQWILLDYDAKNSLFVYTFDHRCPPGEHKFEMVVTDDVGNTATYTCTFKN